MANKEIQSIKIGSNTYDIWAKKVDASAVLGGEGNQLPWSATSALTGAITTATTSGFAAPSAVAKAIEDQIAGVYKVMGSEDYANLTATSAKVNGNVYNLTAVAAGTKDAHNQLLSVGDNVVYVSADNGWDKLGSSLEGFATTAWVVDNLNSATSAETTALWKNITDLVDETVSETIDIASTITGTTPTSAIPNVGAVTAYVSNQISEDAITLNDVDYAEDTKTLNIKIPTT